MTAIPDLPRRRRESGFLSFNEFVNVGIHQLGLKTLYHLLGVKRLAPEQTVLAPARTTLARNRTGRSKGNLWMPTQTPLGGGLFIERRKTSPFCFSAARPGRGFPWSRRRKTKRTRRGRRFAISRPPLRGLDTEAGLIRPSLRDLIGWH